MRLHTDRKNGLSHIILEHPETGAKADSDEEILLNPLFRGRLLFPFNDRIPNGKYYFDGREYSFPINDKAYIMQSMAFYIKKPLNLFLLLLKNMGN